ncbi:phage tail assembly protein [Methylobacterium sp. J-090]|uniref:phage tail assembly protein n=1 Tax=Methylobacterium sp. J-090 TaxID=2836666 RepID=UPI001FB90B57|nr:phage tail assembly protein [Methylobacterium sp. J-090]MCJ2080761.1 phage tail assembly protein [Methylobacterium sp. J-090]
METTSHSRQFIGGKIRRTTITLDYPIEFEGTTYTEIGLRRLTAGEVAAFMDAAREMVEADANANPRAPIFVDTNGEPVPDGLFDALDDDDGFKLDEAAKDFLPRRFQAVPRASDSTPTDGSDTEPTS